MATTVDQLATRTDRGVDHERKGLRSRLSRDVSAVIFDRALCDAEVRGDALAGVARENELENLVLSRTETGDPIGRFPPESG
jgi:hypothetical protein